MVKTETQFQSKRRSGSGVVKEDTVSAPERIPFSTGKEASTARIKIEGDPDIPIDTDAEKEEPPSESKDRLRRYYIRSFKMKKLQVASMINSWWLDSMLYEEMLQWAPSIDALKDNDSVYLRYVGMTTGHDVTERHAQDLNSRTSGLLSALHTYLFNNSRATLNNVTVMEINWEGDEGPNTPEGEDELASRREQALVALLEPRTLLNRHSGGDRYRFAPDKEAYELFWALRTESFQHLMHCVSATGRRKELSQWSLQIMDFQANKFDHASFGDYRVSREFLDEIIKSSTPLIEKESHSLCVHLLGGAPPLQSFRQKTAFWEEKSRSAQLTIGCLSQLFNYELEVGECSNTDPESICSRLPVQNMWNWPLISHSDVALKFLKAYLAISQPLVILAYGRDSAYFCLSGYRHLIESPEKTALTDVVGELSW